ncbi:MAG: hypothetical protein OQJ89_00600, partial [Kangiellaceae bacterium]|nr:hypothetical protein [Kangiellaceae bacterium]
MIKFSNRVLRANLIIGVVTAFVYSLIDFASIQYFKYEIENKTNYQEALLLSEIYDAISDLDVHETQSFLLFRENLEKPGTVGEVDADDRISGVVPKELREIQNNIEEIDFRGRPYELIKVASQKYRYYFLFSIESIKQTELLSYSSLVLGLSISLTVSLLISIKLSGEVVQPLKKMSSAIENINASDEMELLKKESQNIEIKELNSLFSSFLKYDAAIKSVIQREKNLSAHISHEFRTPLSVIMGAIELLEQEQDFDTGISKRIIRRLTNEVNQLRDISEMMLLITRADSDVNNNIELS